MTMKAVEYAVVRLQFLEYKKRIHELNTLYHETYPLWLDTKRYVDKFSSVKNRTLANKLKIENDICSHLGLPIEEDLRVFLGVDPKVVENAKVLCKEHWTIINNTITEIKQVKSAISKLDYIHTDRALPLIKRFRKGDCRSKVLLEAKILRILKYDNPGKTIAQIGEYITVPPNGMLYPKLK